MAGLDLEATRSSRETAPPLHAAESLDPFGLIGSVVEGRYLVERLVGNGGFGVVYRAVHLRLDSLIALKVLRLPPAMSSERRAHQLAGFLKEGKLAFGLGACHPAIARVLEAGVLRARGEASELLPYLALEWLDGMSLSDQLQAWRTEKRGPLSLAETLELLTPIAEALATAHAHGVAHRDVKPANIMLARRGGEQSAVLLDFGLAKAAIAGLSTTARFDDSDGPVSAFTPSYAAPEQWLRRLGPTGPWTDVHALALVCVELLSARQPFDAEDTQQLLAASVDPEVRPLPSRMGIACPSAAEAVLERALRVSPRERYPDARSFWAALCAAAGGPETARGIPRRRTFAWTGRFWERRLGKFSLALAALSLSAAWMALGSRHGGATWRRAPLSTRAAPEAATSATSSVIARTEPRAAEIVAAPGQAIPMDRRPSNTARSAHAAVAPIRRAASAATPTARAASTALPSAAPTPPPVSETRSNPVNLLDSDAFSFRK